MNHCCGQEELNSRLEQQFHCPASQPLFPYSGRSHRDPVHGCPALEVEEVRIQFPGTSHWAVNGVSLKILSGQRVALVGHNGAGKSSLLRAAAGLIEPQSGKILVYGNRVGSCHHRTAFLAQRAEIDWHFPITTAELIMTGRFVHLGWIRRPSAEDRERVEGAMQRLGIFSFANRQISQLSGGQQQRVLIARALVQEASLFLLDEPLNAVDESTKEIVEQVLSDHAERGGSVVMATHDLGRLTGSFDVVIHLSDGRIARQTGSKELGSSS